MMFLVDDQGGDDPLRFLEISKWKSNEKYERNGVPLEVIWKNNFYSLKTKIVDYDKEIIS